MGGLPDQLLVGGFDEAGHCLNQVPLGRGRQRYAQVLLQSFEPMEGQTTAVLQQGNHTGCGGVVLLRFHPLRGFGGEHLAAKITAQLFQFVNSGLNRCLSPDPHQEGGDLLTVDFALQTLGAGIT